MSWHYYHVLYPKNRDYLPSSNELVSLSEQLIKHKWVIDPASKNYQKYIEEYLKAYSRDKAVLMNGWGCVAHSMYETDKELPRLGTSNMREICSPFRLDIVSEMLLQDLEISFGIYDYIERKLDVVFPLHDDSNPHFMPDDYHISFYYSPDYVIRNGEYEDNEEYERSSGVLQSIKELACSCGKKNMIFREQSPQHDFLGDKIYYNCPQCGERLHLDNVLHKNYTLPISRFGIEISFDGRYDGFNYRAATAHKEFYDVFKEITGQDLVSDYYYL